MDSSFLGPGGCASSKAAQGSCPPRKITAMLAKLFANDVRRTHAVVETLLQGAAEPVNAPH